MTVGVQRQGDLRVSERLHDRSRIDTLRKQQRRRGVPQIVKPDRRRAGGKQQRSDVTRDIFLSLKGRRAPTDHRTTSEPERDQ